MRRKQMIILGGGVQDKYDKKGNLIDNFGENDEDWNIYHGLHHTLPLYLTFLLEITEDNIEKEKEHYKAVDEIENELKEVDPFYYEKHNEQKTCLTKEDFFLEMSVDLIRCPEVIF